MDPAVEELLVRAEKTALRILSPLARSIILVFKGLMSGEKRVEELKEYCGMYGFKCTRLERAIRHLEYAGMITCGESSCKLTSDGESVAEALNEVLRELREYAYSVVRGEATELDVFSHVATPLASTIGAIESIAEDPESLTIGLTIHAYVSTLVAALSGLLGRIRPELVDILRKAYGLKP